jgi:hypothetical protein
LNYSKYQQYQLYAFVIEDNFYPILSVLNVGAVLRQATPGSVCSATRLKEKLKQTPLSSSPLSFTEVHYTPV